MTNQKVKIGIVGTSWWVDAMYLPALNGGMNAEVIAICGRNRKRAEARAAQWHIPNVYTDFRDMFASGLFEAGDCRYLERIAPRDYDGGSKARFACVV